MVCGYERHFCRDRFFGAVCADHDEADAVAGRPHRANGDFAGSDLCTRGWRGASKMHTDDALARGAAMLDPRDDLLANVAALFEVHSTRKKVQIGIMRKVSPIGEVDAAVRDTERDSMVAS